MTKRYRPSAGLGRVLLAVVVCATAGSAVAPEASTWTQARATALVHRARRALALSMVDPAASPLSSHLSYDATSADMLAELAKCMPALREVALLCDNADAAASGGAQCEASANHGAGEDSCGAPCAFREQAGAALFLLGELVRRGDLDVDAGLEQLAEEKRQRWERFHVAPAPAPAPAQAPDASTGASAASTKADADTSARSAEVLLPPPLSAAAREGRRAARLYDAAAALGNSAAQHALATAYDYGLLGRARVPALGALHHYFAAMGGHVGAAAAMATRHREGGGVARRCGTAAAYAHAAARSVVARLQGRGGPAPDAGNGHGRAYLHEMGGSGLTVKVEQQVVKWYEHELEKRQRAESSGSTGGGDSGSDDGNGESGSETDSRRLDATLGRLHMQGQAGLPQDYVQAQVHFVRAAHNGGVSGPTGSGTQEDSSTLITAASKAGLALMYLQGVVHDSAIAAPNATDVQPPAAASSTLAAQQKAKLAPPLDATSRAAKALLREAREAQKRVNIGGPDAELQHMAAALLALRGSSDGMSTAWNPVASSGSRLNSALQHIKTAKSASGAHRSDREVLLLSALLHRLRFKSANSGDKDQIRHAASKDMEEAARSGQPRAAYEHGASLVPLAIAARAARRNRSPGPGCADGVLFLTAAANAAAPPASLDADTTPLAWASADAFGIGVAPLPRDEESDAVSKVGSSAGDSSELAGPRLNHASLDWGDTGVRASAGAFARAALAADPLQRVKDVALSAMSGVRHAVGNILSPFGILSSVGGMGANSAAGHGDAVALFDLLRAASGGYEPALVNAGWMLDQRRGVADLEFGAVEAALAASKSKFHQATAAAAAVHTAADAAALQLWRLALKDSLAHMTGPHAMNYLHVRIGDFHYEGRGGLSHSKSEAAEHYRLAASSSARARFNLALLHEDADRRYSLDAWLGDNEIVNEGGMHDGVDISEAEAERLYLSAADMRDAHLGHWLPAQCALARLRIRQRLNRVMEQPTVRPHAQRLFAVLRRIATGIRWAQAELAQFWHQVRTSAGLATGEKAPLHPSPSPSPLASPAMTGADGAATIELDMTPAAAYGLTGEAPNDPAAVDAAGPKPDSSSVTATVLSCFSTLSDAEEPLGKLLAGSVALVVCPRGCAAVGVNLRADVNDVESAPSHSVSSQVALVGENTIGYAARTSVCVAAIHATGKDGGTFRIKVRGPFRRDERVNPGAEQVFEAQTAHGLRSIRAAQKAPSSFWTESGSDTAETDEAVLAARERWRRGFHVHWVAQVPEVVNKRLALVSPPVALVSAITLNNHHRATGSDKVLRLKCGDMMGPPNGHPKLVQLQRGQAIVVHCPRDCHVPTQEEVQRLRDEGKPPQAIADLGGLVWGTRIYSDDSSVCVAARHHTGKNGGIFRVRAGSGRSSFEATRANGVPSQKWGAHGRSFTVGIVDAASLNVGDSWPPERTTQYTAELWFRIDPRAVARGAPFPMRLLSKHWSTDFRIVREGGKLLLQAEHFPDTEGVKGKTNLVPGQWYHAAAVKSVGTADGGARGGLSAHLLYLNGAIDGARRWQPTEPSGSESEPIANEEVFRNEAILTIGSLALQRELFEGQVADVRLWTTARTQSQIRENMRLRLCGSTTHQNAGLPFHGTQPAFDVEGLWGAWSFEGEPKSSITMVDGERRELRTFMDCSGNGHHAVQLKESTRVVPIKPKVPERLDAYNAAWSP